MELGLYKLGQIPGREAANQKKVRRTRSLLLSKMKFEPQSSKMEGYSAIAQLMGSHDEFAIVRRFKELNMQDILYLQAEILHLKEGLERLELDDEEDRERAFYSRDWWSLANAEDEGGKERWTRVLEIRSKLQEYNARIAQQIFLSNQKGPNSYDLAFFRDWLERPNMGNFPLRGIDRNAWDKEYTDDLLAIKCREHADPVSRWFIDGFIPWFHDRFGRRFKKPIPESPLSEISQYNESPLLQTVNIFGTLIASLLPISSIVVLYFVNNAIARLGIVVAFTAMFSITLVLVTQAKRAEVFAATSAFAAVQVVFVSSNYVVVST